MVKPIRIILNDAEVGWSDGTARIRQDMAEQRGNRARNRAPTDRETALKAHVVGCRTELAGKRFLDPIHWHSLNDSRGRNKTPDLGELIDVKGVDERYKRLILQSDDIKDRGHWIFWLIDMIDTHTYDCCGWCYGKEAGVIDQSDPSGRNRSAHFIARNHEIMKPPEALIQLTRRPNNEKP